MILCNVSLELGSVHPLSRVSIHTDKQTADTRFIISDSICE
jgi:hypothetical protein